jgi:glycerol-3-phosphate cytidylyltransferase
MILYTGGTFDLFHYGHMEFLKNCRKLCTKLVVGLNTDHFIFEYKNNWPILNCKERKKSLLLSGLVDEVLENPFGKDSKPIIEAVKPDIIAVGDDWAKKDYYAQMSFTQEWLDEREILLIYLPYTKDISSTIIKERLKW